MPIVKCGYITREFVQENPDILFVFGDNMERKGYCGQARAMRGEPNTVGIPRSLPHARLRNGSKEVEWQRFTWNTAFHSICGF